jgi:hypothetical protein
MDLKNNYASLQNKSKISKAEYEEASSQHEQHCE